jgi:glycosyltransferase involved in cell wall biosynthesis
VDWRRRLRDGWGVENESALPLVSVIIPVLNAEATLAETLRSVAAQSYSNLEILIVDDGSTDATPVIAEAFCALEPRARLIGKENGGVASARNLGIAEARGEWVAPVDADDLWHPAKIERQVAAALAAPARPGFVYCWFRVIDGTGRIIGAGERWRVEGRALGPLAFRNIVGNGSALLLSRAAALEVGGYDESLRARQAEGCEDVALQLEIARRYPVAFVPEYLVGYRFQPDSMSRNADSMARSWQLAHERVRGEVPAKVLRFNAGVRSLALAEAKAHQGAWKAALSLLSMAVRNDPARTGVHLLYRFCRLAARLGRGRRTPPPLEHFNDADPRAELRLDADELIGFARLLERFDQNRMERLGALVAHPADIDPTGRH